MLGLLLLEFNDDVREGNGNQICRCLQFFLQLFKATKWKNYAIEAFIMLAQLNFFFSSMNVQSTKMVLYHTHLRMPGRNVSCDLHRSISTGFANAQ